MGVMDYLSKQWKISRDADRYVDPDGNVKTGLIEAEKQFAREMAVEKENEKLKKIKKTAYSKQEED